MTGAPAKIITFASVKGGVGKSSLALSMADALSWHNNLRVLVVDADQQASISKFLVPGNSQRYHAILSGKQTLGDYLRDYTSGTRRSVGYYTIGSCGNLEYPSSERGGHIFLLSGSLELRYQAPCLAQLREFGNLGSNLNLTSSKSESKLEKLAKCIRGDIVRFCTDQRIDVVLIDTQAGLDAVAELFIKLSDHLIVPVVPDRMSIESLSESVEILRREISGGSIPKHLIFAKVQSAAPEHMERMRTLRDKQLYDKTLSEFHFFSSYMMQHRSMMLLQEHPNVRQTFEEKYGSLSASLGRIRIEFVERLLGR